MNSTAAAFIMLWNMEGPESELCCYNFFVIRMNKKKKSQQKLKVSFASKLKTTQGNSLQISSLQLSFI